MAGKRGFVLAFVLMIILALTILFTCLLCVPGGLWRYTGRYARDVQAVYDAESSIMANLSGFDDSFFAGLPPVSAYSDGIWGHVCAPLQKKGVTDIKLCAQYGTHYSRMRFDDWYSAMLAYRTDLRERIVGASGFRVVSGNRRFFGLDSSVALHIADGDLTLDLDSRVKSAAFLVDGSVSVKGRAHFDTLRIFAAGEVTLGGSVSVGHLEVYSGASVELRSAFRFSGLVFARDEVRIYDKVRGTFPCVAVALGSGNSRIIFQGRSAFAGLLASPGGSVEMDAPDSLAGAAIPGKIRDSSRAVLPVFFEGRHAVFARRVEP